jgi:hypothetical protein
LKEAAMSILGNEETEDHTELWREKAITERALALIAAKEWPPPIRWIDDLLRRDWIPPDGDFWKPFDAAKFALERMLDEARPRRESQHE